MPGQVIDFLRHMSGHALSKLAKYVFRRVNQFSCFLSLAYTYICILYVRKFIKIPLSRHYIELPRGQGHARSRFIKVVFGAYSGPI